MSLRAKTCQGLLSLAPSLQLVLFFLPAHPEEPKNCELELLHRLYLKKSADLVDVYPVPENTIQQRTFRSSPLPGLKSPFPKAIDSNLFP